MQSLVPTPPDQRPPIPDFTPVPRRPRFDGWTPERQRAFIFALAEIGSVKAAAKRINMSAEGAYYLRRQPGAEGFRAAWDAALDHGVQNLADIAIARAIEGVPVPVFYRGEVVGEKRWFNDRLLMFILKHHMPGRYGARPLAPGAKHVETLRREWEAERRAESEAENRKSFESIVDKLAKLRRWYLREVVAADPAKRAAWDLLCGPADWARAARGEGGGYEGENMTYPSAIVLLAGVDLLRAARD